MKRPLPNWKLCGNRPSAWAQTSFHLLIDFPFVVSVPTHRPWEVPEWGHGDQEITGAPAVGVEPWGLGTLRLLLVVAQATLTWPFCPQAVGRLKPDLVFREKRIEGFLRWGWRWGRTDKASSLSEGSRDSNHERNQLRVSSSCFSLARGILVNQLFLTRVVVCAIRGWTLFQGWWTQLSMGKIQTSLNIIKFFFDDS